MYTFCDFWVDFSKLKWIYTAKVGSIQQELVPNIYCSLQRVPDMWLRGGVYVVEMVIYSNEYIFIAVEGAQ
jgi:hypothetical protein